MITQSYFLYRLQIWVNSRQTTNLLFVWMIWKFIFNTFKFIEINKNILLLNLLEKIFEGLPSFSYLHIDYAATWDKSLIISNEIVLLCCEWEYTKFENTFRSFNSSALNMINSRFSKYWRKWWNLTSKVWCPVVHNSITVHV